MSDEKRVPMVPSFQPKTAPDWIEEKDKMLKVIKTQGEYIKKLRDNNEQLKEINDELKDRLDDLEKPIENLEEEFGACPEDIRFSDIGGLDPVLDKLRYFENSILYPKMYEAYAIKPPKGMLLHGPPGCGKTMIAKAISHEIDAFFLDLPITRIISKWVGDAEKTLDAILKRCTEVYKEYGKQVVIHIDEAEQMFRRRGGSGHGVIDRCVTVWLSYMDGMAESEGLIYVASTNRVQLIDEAIKRAGRLDYVLEVPYPDRKGIEEIMRKQVAMKERLAGHTIYKIDDYKRFGDMLYRKRLNGADVEAILKLTSEKKIRSIIESDVDVLPVIPQASILQSEIEATILSYRRAGRSENKNPIGFGMLRGV